ncbi:MAG: homocysteine S-methyltransferase family protein [bacterium]
MNSLPPRPLPQLDPSRIHCLDGAIGTELMRLGWSGDGSSDIWARNHPDIVLSMHARYVDAGAEIVTAATFGANRGRLAKAGGDGEIGALNQEMVGLARQAAGGRAYVAGCIGPTGWEAQFGIAHRAEAQAVFAEQAKALATAGVDLITVETMTSLTEALVAVRAVLTVCSTPIWVCLTFLEGGRLVDGSSAAEAVLSLTDLGVRAVGCNCMPPDDQLIQIVKSMAAVTSVPVVVRPSAGLSSIDSPPTGPQISPHDFAEFAVRLRKSGAGIIGGCCGIGPEHIAQLSQHSAHYREGLQ